MISNNQNIHSDQPIVTGTGNSQFGQTKIDLQSTLEFTSLMRKRLLDISKCNLEERKMYGKLLSRFHYKCLFLDLYSIHHAIQATYHTTQSSATQEENKTLCVKNNLSLIQRIAKSILHDELQNPMHGYHPLAISIVQKTMEELYVYIDKLMTLYRYPSEDLDFNDRIDRLLGTIDAIDSYLRSKSFTTKNRLLLPIGKLFNVLTTN